MKRYGRYFFELLFALPLSVACLMLWQEEFGIRKLSAGFYILTVLSCLACALIRFLKGKDRLLAAGVLLILLGSPALYGLRFGKPGYFFRHRYLWLVPLLCAGCFLCGMLCRYFRAVRILTALSVITGLVLLLVFRYEVSKPCVMLFLTVPGLLLADETQILWHKNGETEHASHLVFIAPFLAAWLFLSLMLPVSDKPYDWRIVKNIWHQIEDFGISLTQKRRNKPDDFDILKPGFTSEAKVTAGRVTEDRRVLLRLESYSGDAPILRVAGQYCDTFEDLCWLCTVEKDLHEYEYDLMETKIAFEKTGRFTDYVHYVDVNLVYREFSSHYFFSPEKLLTDSDALKNAGASQQGHNLLFKTQKGVGSRYNLRFLQLNRRNAIFTEYVRSAPEITEEDWAKYISMENRTFRSLSYEGFLAYRAKMKELYLKKTDISPAVREFLDNVTKDAETDFEKMLLLEKALSEFTYSTSLGSLPANVTDSASFLDWFLETKAGYCVHYATAMTLLARAEGLPARYVHGFCSPVARYSPSKVTADMAHAWCEIYFEGIGWVSFDASPGFYVDAYWVPVTNPDGTRKPTPTPTPTSEASPSPTPTPISVAPKEDEPESHVLRWLLLVAAFLVFFTFAVLLLDRKRTLRRFSRLNAAAQAKALFRRNDRILRYLNLPVAEEETLGEYQTRLKKVLPLDAVDWITAYERFFYGKPDDARPIVQTMLSGNRALTEEFRKRNPKKYLLCKLTNRLIR